jgi:hypothetical protein
MAGKSVAAKIGVKSGMRCLVQSMPAELEPLLMGWPATTQLGSPDGGLFDHLLLFAENQTQLREHAPAILAARQVDGQVWIAYPRRTGKIPTDLSRDRGWDVVSEAGFLPVSLIAIDDTWSALRFRRREEIAVLTRKADFPGRHD